MIAVWEPNDVYKKQMMGVRESNDGSMETKYWGHRNQMIVVWKPKDE